MKKITCKNVYVQISPKLKKNIFTFTVFQPVPPLRFVFIVLPDI